MNKKQRNGALYIAAGITVYLFPQILNLIIAVFLIVMGVLKLLE